LTVSSPRDKLVLEVMRTVLEAIYEPCFVTQSHGFRPGRSCHTALRSIINTFTGCTWWIEGDISKCFDSISHDKLMKLLESKIKDQRFLQLIRKSLNAGYFEFKVHKTSIVGTPQGSIISPILANVFLHQLDLFIFDLQKNFNLKNPEWWRAQYAFKNYKRDSLKVRKLAVALRDTPAKLRNARSNKIMYVRYADDWIVAVNGSFQQTKAIFVQIQDFCTSIGLTVSVEKTIISNSFKDKIFFLGTLIRHGTVYTFFKGKKTSLFLTAPTQNIKSKLSTKGFVSQERGVSQTSWTALTARQIILNFNSILRWYDNYYSFAHNRGTFISWLYYIMWDCALRTLAHKYGLKTRSKAIKHFGINIVVKDQVVNKTGTIVRSTKLYKPSYKLNMWDFKIRGATTNIPQQNMKRLL
jgi:group II intron reverse transcriptase/maturase